MEASARHDGVVGYLATDLEEFFAAARARMSALESAIAEEQARRARAGSAEALAIAGRQQLAEAWTTALRDAEQLRASAQSEAAAIVEEAHRTARAIRAKALLDGRATSETASAGTDGR